MLSDCGIYEIRNTLNGKRYVGSSKRITRRFTEHRKMLKDGVHHSAALQNAWNRYGSEAFVFSTLAILKESELVTTEQRLIDQAFNEADNYNCAKSAVSPMLGRKHSHKTLVYMSESRKGSGNSFYGKKMSEEHKAKLAAINRGRPSPIKGKRLSEDHRAKLSTAKAGKPPPNKGKLTPSCKRGHIRTEENTYIHNGMRNCKICLKAATNRYQAKLKENRCVS